MHRDGLVAHNGLVVTLRVAHHLLLPAAVGHGVGDVAHVPLLVGRVVQVLDPHVGHEHAEAVVEAEPPVLESPAERGHARHVLRDRDCVRVYLPDEGVGQHQVGDPVQVGVQPEVLVVVAREAHADAVVLVEDGGDGVEAEAVHLVLVEEPGQVREQEALHLVLGVVEEHRVPLGVVALRAPVREAVVRPVEVLDPVVHVVGGVRVHQVDHDLDAEPVGLVNQVLEVVGGAGARRHSKKSGDVVAEAGVVGVLLDGHQLDHVVAVLLAAGQVVVGEVAVGAHAPELLSHAHVALVNAQALLRLGHGAGVGPHILLRRVPVDAVVEVGVGVLAVEARPRRVPVHAAAVGRLDVDLVLSVVRDARGAVGLCTEEDAPDPEVVFLAPKLLSVPAVEVSEDGEALGVGGPLAVLDVAVGAQVEAELEVAPGDGSDAPLGVLEGLQPLSELADAQLDVVLVVLQVGVVHDHGQPPAVGVEDLHVLQIGIRHVFLVHRWLSQHCREDRVILQLLHYSGCRAWVNGGLCAVGGLGCGLGDGLSFVLEHSPGLLFLYVFLDLLKLCE
mmetsp:Transcript_6310/g.10708  ORF Transcript_6310/g.10708 Transcript_6310/m.10708 type:complete len:559 (+) Transcript_6310:975-2651(+)